MKKVSEIAKENNVSVQTVYRKLKSISIKHDGLTIKHGNITYITDVGVSMLSKCLTDVEQECDDIEQIVESVEQVLNTPESQEILYLREQNTNLLNQLNVERAHSREQSNRISDLADKLADLSRNNQILLRAEQQQQEQQQHERQPDFELDSPDIITNDKPKIKKSIWNIFKK